MFQRYFSQMRGALVRLILNPHPSREVRQLGLEPSALRRQSRDARTTGQRSAVASGTTVYALSKLLCMHAQPQPPGALHQLSKNNIRAPSLQTPAFPAAMKKQKRIRR